MSGARMFFPDFELVHRREQRTRWLLEIVGFWTAEYPRDKIEAFRAVDNTRLIICIDADRNCGPSDFPAATHVIQYRRHVDLEEVLKAIAALT